MRVAACFILLAIAGCSAEINCDQARALLRLPECFGDDGHPLFTPLSEDIQKLKPCKTAVESNANTVGEHAWAAVAQAAERWAAGEGKWQHLPTIIKREASCDVALDGVDDLKRDFQQRKPLPEAGDDLGAWAQGNAALVDRLRAAWWAAGDHGKQLLPLIDTLNCERHILRSCSVVADYNGDLMAEAEAAIPQDKVMGDRRAAVKKLMVEHLARANLKFEGAWLANTINGMTPGDATEEQTAAAKKLQAALSNVFWKLVRKWAALRAAMPNPNEDNTAAALFTRSWTGSGTMKKPAEAGAAATMLEAVLSDRFFNPRIQTMWAHSLMDDSMGAGQSKALLNTPAFMEDDEHPTVTAMRDQRFRMFNRETCPLDTDPKLREQTRYKVNSNYRATMNAPGWTFFKEASKLEKEVLHDIKIGFPLDMDSKISMGCMAHSSQVAPPMDKLLETTWEPRGEESPHGFSFDWQDMGINQQGVLADAEPPCPRKQKSYLKQSQDLALPFFAGSSSTTAAVWGRLVYGGWTADELLVWRLAFLQWMIQPRDHSFHEIMVAIDASARRRPADGPKYWPAHNAGNWHKAYRNLLLKADGLAVELEGDDSELKLRLGNKEFTVPAAPPAKITNQEFESLFPCFPDFYFSETHQDFLLELLKADEGRRAKLLLEHDAKHCGLLSGEMPYCMERKDDQSLLPSFAPVAKAKSHKLLVNKEQQEALLSDFDEDLVKRALAAFETLLSLDRSSELDGVSIKYEPL